MSRDAEGVLFRGRSCSRQQPAREQAINGGGGGGDRGLPPMRLATGGGGGGRGRRREARSGLRLSVSAPPPPPPRVLNMQHSKKKSEGATSPVVGVVGGARNDEKSQAASSASSSTSTSALTLTSRRLTLLGVPAAAIARDARPADVASGYKKNTILKTTRTRKPQNTTRRPTAAAAARRTVRFDRCVRMVLVPARRDLDAAIVHGVWWGAEDVAEFRMAAAKYFFKHGGRVARRSSIGGDGGRGDGDGATASGEEPSSKQEAGTKPAISAPTARPLPEKAAVG